MENIAGIFFLAMLVEGSLTYLFGASEEPRPWIKYLSLVLGMAAAIAYQVDIPASLGMESPVPYVGSIVSGLLIGRGSNYLNDFLGALGKK